MVTKKKSTKEKGAELEREFAEYMENELKYNECFLNEKVKGKISTNEYEVDIIGKKLNEKGEIMRGIGWILLIMGIVAFVLYFLDVIMLFKNDMILFGIIGVVVFFILDYGKKTMYDYTWVECKNWETRIDKNPINNLAMNAQDYHNSEDKKFEFSKLIFVSGSGFIKNALRFAEDKNIECFERTGKNEFQEIEASKIV